MMRYLCNIVLCNAIWCNVMQIEVYYSTLPSAQCSYQEEQCLCRLTQTVPIWCNIDAIWWNLMQYWCNIFRYWKISLIPAQCSWEEQCLFRLALIVFNMVKYWCTMMQYWCIMVLWVNLMQYIAPQGYCCNCALCLALLMRAAVFV